LALRVDAGAGPSPQRFYYQHSSLPECLEAREAYLQDKNTISAVCSSGAMPLPSDRQLTYDKQRQELIERVIKDLGERKR